jgi:hypothetical protein
LKATEELKERKWQMMSVQCPIEEYMSLGFHLKILILKYSTDFLFFMAGFQKLGIIVRQPVQYSVKCSINPLKGNMIVF